MEQKSCHKLIYKLTSKQLKKSNWNLTLPLKTAMRDCPDCIVALNDSQCLRFIDEINNRQDINDAVKCIQRKIRETKKKPKTRETKMLINKYYDNLYNLQFQKDYVCVIMENNADYDRANDGFSINFGQIDGKSCIIRYRRLLGTNGGIKNSTIVYVNEEIYPELKKRLDNGRNMEKELVPAKLEAYQALICSGSIPIPEPNGIIVVNDCITHFKENIILLNDENSDEPIMSYENDFDIEHNDSDGYGLMLPSYSRKVNEYLTGDGEHTIAGMNTRYAWTKGMVYTFDYLEFAEKVAGTYEIIDAWGDKRDVRNAEVILTVSMLKLWDSYESWEDYYRNCQENHYQFSTPKTTPEELEGVRDTNYQFLQSYHFTDEEIQELCQPTIDEIKDVLGMDYRKSIVFLAGFGLNEKNAFGDNIDYCVKALMADERMINDPYIRRKIWNMIRKRIEMGERGAIRINANFAMISGDPYALAQSMFGLEITGLLKAGEVYHKYWIDRSAEEIACFRAPMTCHNNIRRMKLADNENTRYWYQYITTALIFNAFDTACDAMNGADKDGDTNMCTDNPVILHNTKNLKTIVCVQRKADKTIPSEEDIIKANKLAFNDDIGTVTNHITGMFEVQAGFEPGTREYETLDYRIMCGQLYQQNTIDRAKGVIAKSMPSYWYSYRDNKVTDDDDIDDIERKEFNKSIVAATKPYFMTYVYPSLRTQNNLYQKSNNQGVARRFWEYGIYTIQELEAYQDKTDEMIEYLDYYYKLKPVGTNACIVNRICWLFENTFSGYLSKKFEQPAFDCSILKSDAEYSRNDFNKIYAIYKEYLQKLELFKKKTETQKVDVYDLWMERDVCAKWFKGECEKICPNEDELCNIVIDMLYHTENSKQFAWDVCGSVIIKNLLKNSNGQIQFPEQTKDGGDFQYCGINFVMRTKTVGGEIDDYS